MDSLEIDREVRMRLQLETESLLPGNDQATGSLVPPGNKKPNPPVEVSCSGPFHFDFVRYIASVDRDVLLRQIHPNGPSDQLTCNQLDIHFAPKPLVEGQADPVIVDPGKRQQRELGRLEPVAIVAEGLPVVVTSPSRGAEARGDRIQIGLRDRRRDDQRRTRSRVWFMAQTCCGRRQSSISTRCRNRARHSAISVRPGPDRCITCPIRRSRNKCSMPPGSGWSS